MSQSLRRKRAEVEAGFSLLEVLVAVTILSIGLMGSAALLAFAYKGSVRSRYMAEAAQLASEKLEDLNRYPANTTSGGVVYLDPHIFVPSGENDCGIAGESCVGSIAPALICTGPGHCAENPGAAPQTIAASQTGAGTYGTVAISAATISYSDAVFLTMVNGQISETYLTAGGVSPTYTTLTYSPNGATPVPTTTNTAPGSGETFDRRWTIEQDQPVNGVRRVTVLVTLLDISIQPAVTFQMSTVRP